MIPLYIKFNVISSDKFSTQQHVVPSKETVSDRCFILLTFDPGSLYLPVVEI